MDEFGCYFIGTARVALPTWSSFIMDEMFLLLLCKGARVLGNSSTFRGGMYAGQFSLFKLCTSLSWTVPRKSNHLISLDAFGWLVVLISAISMNCLSALLSTRCM